MEEQKILIIGTIPDNFDINKHLPVSPSCFINKEHIYKDWETIDFGRDPFGEPMDRYKAGLETSAYALQLIEEWRVKLNKELNEEFSFRFWRMMMFPFFLFLLQALLDKQERLLSVINKYKDSPVSIFLKKPKKRNWMFKDSQDFLTNGLQNPSFDVWLYQKILEYIQLPEQWKIVYEEDETPDVKQEDEKIETITLRQRLANWVNILFRRCGTIYGFSLRDRILFNMILRFKKATPNTSKSAKTNYISNLSYKCDPNLIIDEVLPQSFRFLPNLKKERRINFVKGKFNLGSQYLLHNDKLKLRYALACEEGEQIIGVQHGGHDYGSSLVFDTLRETEYQCEKFITWGFKKQDVHSKNLVGNLPNPYLNQYVNQHKKENSKIILVSTKMNLFVHRFEGLPHPIQNIAYRQNKAAFIHALNKEVYKDFYYRPYFNDFGGLKDTTFFLEKFPTLNILKGNLHPHIVQCNLLILDHPGTTLNIALVANIPTICFWKREHFPFTQEANKFLNEMEKLKMFFDCPYKAAEFVNNTKGRITDWWESQAVQYVKNKWCENYALTDKNWKKEWINYIRNL